MNIVLSLEQKYKLNTDSYSAQELVEIPEWMYEKWSDYYGEGWYGIDLGLVPAIWVNVIDEFLDWVKENESEFYIQQLKVKYGRLRLTFGNVSHDTQMLAYDLEDLLFDKRLVY